ncbi:DUF2827 domain-containing protein [Xanthomonas sp. SHU 166]|uniref:DUF2827 domain-containing protein n=1 Tax=Xanthomonas sp. SHU 166 TaxID=1591170 RepID=UPI00039AB7A8|nr:DUF2827 domain-containing protein [Xanthomonas sp. SHU 166]
MNTSVHDAALLPRSLRIGITIGLHQPNESLWINGIKQNAVYLAKLLQNSRYKHKVTLVNVTDIAVAAGVPWDTTRFATCDFDACKDDLDVMIELGGQVDPARTDYLKSRGTRLVSYCCGFEYIHNAQAILFGRRLWDQVFVNRRYDAIWVIPQVAESSLSFFEAYRRRPARVVPFVWDPMFLEAAAQNLPEGGRYRPRNMPKRLTVMEPNRDITKFCLYPVLIAEALYRRSPHAVAHLHVTNAQSLAESSPEFVGLMRELDIVRDGKASFVGRYETPQFLSEFTDVVISHQWLNPLNYFYFDVCWQGYPLIHNAALCPELGYYYEGNDIEQGRHQLVRAVVGHDRRWLDYLARQREVIGAYCADNPRLAAEYDELLFGLYKTPLLV